MPFGRRNLDLPVQVDLSGRLQLVDLWQVDLRRTETEFLLIDADAALLRMAE